jgi:DNA-binding HxlR family transcriptional regulator
VKGYGQFCAVARALEILGERWTLLIVRELLMGACGFNDICRGLPRLPRATLSSRLNTLTAAGIVRAADDGYRLTEAGLALEPVVRELARWATSTDAAALSDEHLDTAALTWDISRRVDIGALPDRTVVLALDFSDRPAADRRFWLHLSRARVDLCRQDTGAPVDLWLTSPASPVTRWWLGEMSWPDLLRQPGVTVTGERALQRQMHRWFQRYVFAGEPHFTHSGS